MRELYGFIEGIQERLKARLVKNMPVRQMTIKKWEAALADISIEEFLRSFAGVNYKYDPLREVLINFIIMRPNRMMYDYATGSVPDSQYYFLTFGVGVLPEFKFHSFTHDPKKVMRLVRLIGDKTKFEILRP